MVTRAGERRRIASSGWRILQILGLGILVVVVSSIFLEPVHSLWSSNLLIKGDASVRKVPDRCEDMHFDKYMWGTEGDDVIYGTSGNDMIWGLGGNDKIYGSGGDDCYDGGDNDDRCDDDHGWYDSNESNKWYDPKNNEHDSKRKSCDQWGWTFNLWSSWHHSVPTVELAWDAVEGAVYYNIYRSTALEGPYEVVGTTSNTTYTDEGVTEDVEIFYVVTAVDVDGFESIPSTKANETVPSDAVHDDEGESALPPDPGAPEVTTAPENGETAEPPVPSDTTGPETKPTPPETTAPTVEPAPTPEPTPEVTKPPEPEVTKPPEPEVTKPPEPET
jgi:hypothetical protein